MPKRRPPLLGILALFLRLQLSLKHPGLGPLLARPRQLSDRSGQLRRRPLAPQPLVMYLICLTESKPGMPRTRRSSPRSAEQYCDQGAQPDGRTPCPGRPWLPGHYEAPLWCPRTRRLASSNAPQTILLGAVRSSMDNGCEERFLLLLSQALLGPSADAGPKEKEPPSIQDGPLNGSGGVQLGPAPPPHYRPHLPAGLGN